MQPVTVLLPCVQHAGCAGGLQDADNVATEFFNHRQRELWIFHAAAEVLVNVLNLVAVIPLREVLVFVDEADHCHALPPLELAQGGLAKAVYEAGVSFIGQAAEHIHALAGFAVGEDAFLLLLHLQLLDGAL